MDYRDYSIPVAKPSVTSLERKYVGRAVRSSWIGSKGYYLNRATEEFSTVCGVQHVSLVTNGTVALHLALLALEIKSGDEVIVPDLTYVAVPNAVRYCQALPVFCPVDDEHWNIDPMKIAELITIRTRAVIVVNSFGRIADYDAIRKELVRINRSDIKIIEDASQSHLAYVGNRPAGSFGDISTFSFFANKVITSGEGGAVCSSNKSLIERVDFLKNQAIQSNRQDYFHFPEVGFNFRMTNIAAAILCAQIERRHSILARRLEIYDNYNSHFIESSSIKFQTTSPGCLNAPWLYPVRLSSPTVHRLRSEAIEYLKGKSIESRPFFSPLSRLPMFQSIETKTSPITDIVSISGLNLPTYFDLTKRDTKFIAQSLIAFLERFS